MAASENCLYQKKLQQLTKDSLDLHCHGLGCYDFTDVSSLDLDNIETILAKRNYSCALTLYLPKHGMDAFLQFMERFHHAKQSGLYPHIAGIGLEGPLLEHRGGSPANSCWIPEKEHWQLLSDCGKLGLIYIIFSPDSSLGISETINITETLLDGNVLPTPGHFNKNAPKESAKALSMLFDIVKSWGKGPTITDHLYNDMPLNFKHAWRGENDILKRNEELKAINLDSWSLKNLDEKLGLVPATMIRYAQQGVVKLSLNFDGEHVDHAIAKKTVELVGAENILILTDSVEGTQVAGVPLHTRKDSSLLYQPQEIVAVGSQGMQKQIENMILIGLCENDITQIVKKVPKSVLHTLA